MAKQRRVLRLQQLILEILGETMVRDVEDPRLQLVTFTRVKLTKDLEHATVYWSCLAKESAREEIEEVLTGALSFFQGRIGAELRIRTTPKLDLRFDPSLEHAQRLETIFHNLQVERGDPEAEAEEGEEGEDDANPPANG